MNKYQYTVFAHKLAHYQQLNKQQNIA